MTSDIQPPSSAPVTRCVLVTGSSSGIGLELTRQLLAGGHTVVGIARRAQPEQERLVSVQLDLMDLDAMCQRVANLLRRHPIDALVANAGRGEFGSIENFSPQQIADHLLLNLASPLALARTCLPSFKRLERSDLIFVGSESALSGGRYGSVYSAAKFGLRGAAQALRHECSGANCHVGMVQPGMVRTPFFDALDFEPGDATEQALLASDVATAILSMLLAADHAVVEEIVVNPLHRVAQRKPAP